MLSHLVLVRLRDVIKAIAVQLVGFQVSSKCDQTEALTYLPFMLSYFVFDIKRKCKYLCVSYFLLLRLNFFAVIINACN